jgi:hypothetical protein
MKVDEADGLRWPGQWRGLRSGGEAERLANLKQSEAERTRGPFVPSPGARKR